MFHVGRPCWGEIWWLILRHTSPCGPHATYLDHKCQGIQEHMTTLPAPLTSLPVQKDTYSCKIAAWKAEERLFPSQMVKPISHIEGAVFQRYLSCYEKTTCLNTSLSQLSIYSTLKSDSKNHQFLRELLSALKHRPDVSVGATDQDSSRGLSTQAQMWQKRCPLHCKAVTLQGAFFPSVLPAHDNSDIHFPVPVLHLHTASALGGMPQLHCIHHLSNTSVDKLSGSYRAPPGTIKRKALLRASSSSSQDIFPCLMLQAGAMQNRRDVGWVGGLQHVSIFI